MEVNKGTAGASEPARTAGQSRSVQVHGGASGRGCAGEADAARSQGSRVDGAASAQPRFAASFLLPSVALGVTVALAVGGYEPLSFDASSVAKPRQADAVELETVEVDAERANEAPDAESPSGVRYSAADYRIDVANLRDGVYTGSGQGYRSTITVQVTVEGGRISAVEVLSSGDDEPYFTNARAVISRVLSAQSTGVDAVTGATYSSRGILVAIANALSQASGGAISADDVAAPPAGDAADIDGMPADADDPKPGDGENGGADSDVTPARAYADGEYTGRAFGYKSVIEVSVTVKDGKIAALKIVSHDDDAKYFARAMALIPRVLDKQTTDVDTVTGATYSSRGILDAAAEALELSARKAAEDAAAKGDGAATDAPAGEAGGEGASDVGGDQEESADGKPGAADSGASSEEPAPGSQDAPGAPAGEVGAGAQPPDARDDAGEGGPAHA